MSRYRMNPYDDGVLLYGAERVLVGDIPYKDFYYILTPGNLYFLAFIFKIFGTSVLIAKIMNTIVCFFILITTYLLARKIIENIYALILVIILSTFSIWLMGSYANQNLPLLFSLFSGIFFLNYMENGKNLYLILSGIFIGLAGVFRQDFALYTFISVSIILLIYQYRGYSSTPLEGIAKSLRTWLLLLGSSLLILIPLFVYLLLMVPFSDLVSQFLVHPSSIYSKFNPISYPLPKNIYYIITMYLPPFILLLTSFWLVLRIKNKMINLKDWKVSSILLSGVIFAYGALIMPYSYHMYLTMICAMILLSFLLSEYVDIHKIISRFQGSEMDNQSFNIIITCLSVLFIMVFSAYSIHMCFEEINDSVPLNIPKASGMYLSSSESDLIETVDYVGDTVPANEKILVGSYSHDKMVVNEVIIYFLADRKSATKYSEMLEGVTTQSSVQGEIIGDLKKNDVKYIILYVEKDFLGSVGATDLMEYIKTNYKPIKTIGNYTIYKRVGLI